jgi:2,3-bisphosphoglycerate-independent phosphoglycerate mutase
MTNTSATLRRPALLVILDGFGINPDPTHNAIVQAATPNFDRYFASYPMHHRQAGPGAHR